MASAAYTVELDWARDNAYGHASADVSDRVIGGLQWSNGMGSSYEEVAPPARLQLTLSNHDGAFNQDDSGATFYDLLLKNVNIRVKATSGSTRTLYIGKVKGYAFGFGRTGSLTVGVTAEGPMLRLLGGTYDSDLQTDVTTDAVIQKVFEKSTALSWPYDSTYLILDAGKLDTAKLLDATQIMNFETGKTTLAYAGDLGGKEGVNSQNVIRNTVAAEAGGRFWWDTRTAKFVFHNREHDPTNSTVAATITEANVLAADVQHADDVVNDLTIHYEPREVGAVGTVLFQSSAVPFELKKNTQKRVTVRYRDPDNDGQVVGATTVITPVRGNDLIANSQSDGGGDDLTNDISFNIDGTGTGGTLTVMNDSAQDAWITTLKVRGTPLTTYNKESYRNNDPQDVFDNSRMEKSLSLPALSNADFTEGYTQFLVSRFKKQLTRLAAITVNGNQSAAMIANVLDRKVSDRITITDAWSTHDRDYVIVGEQHNVAFGGDNLHDVTWILRPIERIKLMVLDAVGFGELDGAAVLGL